MSSIGGIADKAISVTNLVGRIAMFGEKALPVAQVVADFLPIPYASALVKALTIAAPYLSKIEAAAPVIADAIDKGRPIIAALEQAGPSLVPDLKAIYAIAVNHDPARPETAMTAAQVTDNQVAAFAGVVFTPGRTNEEQQREWDRDKPSMG